MKNILIEELNNYDIKKYKMKKDYNTIQIIKKNILNNHKEEIEWIEIESIGTKYVIKYEPRIINKKAREKVIRDIVAKKDCVIKSMDIRKGEIIKNINSYVKKGETIISGNIKLNEDVKNYVSSEGVVYGLTWYKVTITYPFIYKDIHETGNKKDVYVINFLNKQIELFNKNKYKTKNIKDNILLKNNLLPIFISKQTQKETIVIDENNTEEELIEKALNMAKNKIESNLKNKEYIDNYKILNKRINSSSITLDIFFSVIEDITDYKEIQINN